MDSIGRMQLSNRDLRENFEVARNMLAKANGVTPQQVDTSQLTQGFLRTSVVLTVAQGVFQFAITSLDQIAGSPNTPITNLVQSVDAFVAGSMGYYLLSYQYVGNYNTMDFSDVGTYGNCWYPITYPSAWYNNGSANSFDNGVYMFWLGYLKIEVNSRILYKQWDLMRHLKIPRTQSSPAAGITPSQQLLQKDEYDGSVDSFHPMEPLPVFSGSKQNVVQMTLPGNIPANIRPFNQTGIGYGTTFVLMAFLHFRGVTCQNASSLK